MKNIVFIFIISLAITQCSSQNTSYTDEIKLFQYELNTEYADKSKSPLTEEDFKSFKSLDFFEINEKYKVIAEFELTPNTPIFELKTTTDRLPLYRKYGIATFILEGKKHTLNIYQSQDLMNSLEYENYLFLPFNDATNGKSSYGGGRFIDLEIPKDGRKTIVIDFNKAYNPYCAYNHKYSCPIPPKENLLAIPISAGVKAYKKH
ncbi:DUF1684 domain-containing protein [Lutibacter sp.]|uniref:DUF1684 domain-containing protein n=1 Tax=Lutibacter sp. TaxID=1925666 RepID=UPI001A31C1F3|nr:DUF1684 domain-containing protein [Lutibacter sp.]MBI9040486.1 DUF1684 domain-containing protein [Lutibacter sp.]